jgi:hypothetical protein
LRERQLPGVGQNDVLAGLRIEHDLGRLQFCLVILEAAHVDRGRRHEAMTKRGLAGGFAARPSNLMTSGSSVSKPRWV